MKEIVLLVELPVMSFMLWTVFPGIWTEFISKGSCKKNTWKVENMFWLNKGELIKQPKESYSQTLDSICLCTFRSRFIYYLLFIIFQCRGSNPGLCASWVPDKFSTTEFIVRSFACNVRSSAIGISRYLWLSHLQILGSLLLWFLCSHTTRTFIFSL